MKRFILCLILLCASLAGADEYLGSWKIDDYITITVTTHQFSTGNAYAATGNVLLDIYEDDTNTEIVDDTTMSNFDGRTGLYQVKVQLLTATGFEKGKHYTCVVAATVDSVSALWTANFQIEAEVDSNTNSGTVTPAAASITAAVLATDCITSDELASTALTEIENEVLDASLQGNAHQTKRTVGWYIRRAAGGEPVTLHSGTAQAGASGSITLENTASTDDDVYNLQRVSIVAGTGVGQSQIIADYTGSTFVATTVGTWVTTPDNTSQYIIEAATISEYSDVGLAQAGGASSITLASSASSYDNIYTGFVSITSGTGSGQTRQISTTGTWYNGTTKVLTTATAWGTPPDNTSVYAIFPYTNTVSEDAGVSIEQIQWAIDARLDTTDTILGTPAAGDLATDIANISTATLNVDANDLANTVLVTTVASATSASQFVLTAGDTTTNQYQYHYIKVTDGDDSQSESGFIKTYSVGTSREVVLDSALKFTPAAGDTAIVYGYREPKTPDLRP